MQKKIILALLALSIFCTLRFEAEARGIRPFHSSGSLRSGHHRTGFRHRYGRRHRHFGHHARPHLSGQPVGERRFASSGSSTGIASWYTGWRTASGERFSGGALTAAHRFWPFGTRVLVTNSRSGRSVVVRINDRGPFVRGRVIDLSRSAAQAVGIAGLGRVSLQRL